MTRHVEFKTNGFYSLKDTLTCGQVFRWSDNGAGLFVVLAGDKGCVATQNDNYTLSLRIQDKADMEEFWRDYFNVDADYSEAQAICKNFGGALATMADVSKGIRLLNQDPWETVISFIISQRNNIPKIKSTIEKLCAKVGNRESDELGYWYKFPKPDEILGVADFDGVGLGYRDTYIIRAAEEVASGRLNLNSLKGMSYENVVMTLEGLYGVGPKVANCIALFGYHKTEAFPIDVWIARAINEYFDGSLNYGAFGKWAGIIQQYIFFYARNIEGK